MNRPATDKNVIVNYLKKGYGSLFPSFSKVQPQMPKEQISFFMKQAVKKQRRIIIQVNPTTHSDGVNEFKGIGYFSPTSAQVILKPDDSRTTFLINAKDIRHIRLTR